MRKLGDKWQLTWWTEQKKKAKVTVFREAEISTDITSVQRQLMSKGQEGTSQDDGYLLYLRWKFTEMFTFYKIHSTTLGIKSVHFLKYKFTPLKKIYILYWLVSFFFFKFSKKPDNQNYIFNIGKLQLFLVKKWPVHKQVIKF